MAYQRPFGDVTSNHGGKRPGAGRKPGSGTVDETRNVRKQLRWTEAEWAEVERRAAASDRTTADYQRAKILTGVI